MSTIYNLSLSRLDGDSYLLQWQCDQPTPVAVYASEFPNSGFQLCVRTDQTQLTIKDAGAKCYFLLQSASGFYKLFERRIDMIGTPNLRDFGGYTTGSGALIKTGYLYRSGRLSSLTESDSAVFASLAIAKVFDFRRPEEVARQPSVEAVKSRVKTQQLPIGEGSMKSFEALLYDANLTQQDLKLGIRGIYKDLATFHAPKYRALFQELSVTQEPVLIHCTAGKDRTGMGAALILLALGVDRTTIVNDYLLTREFYPNELERKDMQAHYLTKGGVASTLDYLLSVQTDFIEVLFELIDNEYEGAEHYLQQVVGLGDSELSALRSRLLVTADQLITG